jgi:molybdenum cofactor cytidylyltransferase
VTPCVAAIVPAAGLSRRMGSCKQLLPLGGTTVIARVLETLLRGGIREVVTVVGPRGAEVAAEAQRYPVTVVRSSDPEGDMAASVRLGRDALSGEVSGVVVALCDHPLVVPETIASLCYAHGSDPAAIIISCHGGGRGHPTLFPRHVLNELRTGCTLRDLVRHDPARVRHLEVADPGVLMDMDTPEEYRRITEWCRSAS